MKEQVTEITCDMCGETISDALVRNLYGQIRITYFDYLNKTTLKEAHVCMDCDIHSIVSPYITEREISRVHVRINRFSSQEVGVTWTLVTGPESSETISDKLGGWNIPEELDNLINDLLIAVDEDDLHTKKVL